VVCKGPEVTLPGGMPFEDKEGKFVMNSASRGGSEDCSTYKMVAHGPHSLTDSIPRGHVGSNGRPAGLPLSRTASRVRALLVCRDAGGFIAQRCLPGLQLRSSGSSARGTSMEWRGGLAILQRRLGEMDKTDEVRCRWAVSHGVRR
jgi:hypothetical protein